MFYAFRDMLEDNSPSYVWLTVLGELPMTILKEHASALRGGELSMKRNVLSVLVGIVSIVVLYLGMGYLQSTFNIIIPNPLTHDINQFGSVFAWLAYFLSGIIVGIITKKAHAVTALIAGGVTWALWIVFNIIIMHTYFFGGAQYPAPYSQILLMSFIYFAQLGGAMVILTAIGGLVGGRLRNKLGIIQPAK